MIQSISGVEVAPLKEAETEDLEYVTDPNEYANGLLINFFLIRFCRRI